MELVLEAAASGGASRVVSLSVDSPTADLGRADLGHGGSATPDRTISRRHVSLRLLPHGAGGDDPVVAFEVVGRNSVVVRGSPEGGGGCGGSRVFRRGEKGELRAGDGLSLSLKEPAFWVVRRRVGKGEEQVEPAVLEAVSRRDRRTRERKEMEREKRAAEEEAKEIAEEEEEEAAGSDAAGTGIDLARVDPVREFGFLSMGHEFDSYPKGRIRPPKYWNWFLEEIKRSSDDEDDAVSNGRGRSKGRGRNKKKGGGGENEDWTDESEDEKESLARGPSVKRSKYSTRSKDPKRPCKDNLNVKSDSNSDEDDEGEEEDEQDETLGGFIVNEEDDEAMEELTDEEEEEEEFDDEDDD